MIDKIGIKSDGMTIYKIRLKYFARWAVSLIDFILKNEST